MQQFDQLIQTLCLKSKKKGTVADQELGAFIFQCGSGCPIKTHKNIGSAPCQLESKGAAVQEGYLLVGAALQSADHAAEAPIVRSSAAAAMKSSEGEATCGQHWFACCGGAIRPRSCCGQWLLSVRSATVVNTAYLGGPKQLTKQPIQSKGANLRGIPYMGG
jgi:hypothetical protein